MVREHVALRFAAQEPLELFLVDRFVLYEDRCELVRLLLVFAQEPGGALVCVVDQQ